MKEKLSLFLHVTIKFSVSTILDAEMSLLALVHIRMLLILAIAFSELSSRRVGFSDPRMVLSLNNTETEEKS